jgi:hypothetical protein
MAVLFAPAPVMAKWCQQSVALLVLTQEGEF